VNNLDWTIVGSTATTFAALFGVVVWYFARRDKKNEVNNEAIKQEIATSVDNLGKLLLAKLETKEKVAQISERLARLEGAAGSSLMRRDDVSST